MTDPGEPAALADDEELEGELAADLEADDDEPRAGGQPLPPPREQEPSGDERHQHRERHRDVNELRVKQHGIHGTSPPLFWSSRA